MIENARLFLIIVSAFIVSIYAKAQPSISTDTIPVNLIKVSVDKFAKYLGPQFIHELGLKSKEELLSLKPSTQYRFFLIGLEAIRNYKQGDDVGILIKEFPEIEVVLIDASGKIRTSIGYVKRNGKWDLSTFGFTPETNAIQGAQQLIGDKILSEGDLIRIPALDLSFIAMKSPQRMDFIVLSTNPTYGFQKGKKLSASDVIWKLVPAAKSHNGLPN